MSNVNTLAYVVGGVFVLIILIITLAVMGLFSPKQIEVTGSLVVWGLYDDGLIWMDIVQKFKELYPRVHVYYYRVSEYNYEDTLLERLAAGN